MNINIETLHKAVIHNVRLCYDFEQKNLQEIGKHHKTEGEIRFAAGELVEKILQNIFDTINQFLYPNKIISNVGSSDYLKKVIKYKGNTYSNNHIQVDRHIWYNNKRIAFIENKTYLDTCYYDRALADFKKIIQALLQQKINPKSCQFIVFAGQKAGRDSTFLNYEAEFWYETKHILNTDEGIEPKIFYFLKGTRNSSKPLYKIKHELNEMAINNFVDLILSLI